MLSLIKWRGGSFVGFGVSHLPPHTNAKKFPSGSEVVCVTSKCCNSWLGDGSAQNFKGPLNSLKVIWGKRFGPRGSGSADSSKKGLVSKFAKWNLKGTQKHLLKVKCNFLIWHSLEAQRVPQNPIKGVFTGLLNKSWEFFCMKHDL